MKDIEPYVLHLLERPPECLSAYRKLISRENPSLVYAFTNGPLPQLCDPNPHIIKGWDVIKVERGALYRSLSKRNSIRLLCNADDRDEKIALRVNPTLKQIEADVAHRSLLSRFALLDMIRIEDLSNLLSSPHPISILNDNAREMYGGPKYSRADFFVDSYLPSLTHYCVRKRRGCRLLTELTSIETTTIIDYVENPTPHEAFIQDRARHLATGSSAPVSLIYLRCRFGRFSLAGPWIRPGLSITLTLDFLAPYVCPDYANSYLVDICVEGGLDVSVLNAFPIPPQRGPLSSQLRSFPSRSATTLLIVAPKGFGKTEHCKRLAASGYLVIDSDTYGRWVRYVKNHHFDTHTDAARSFLLLSPAEREKIIPWYLDLLPPIASIDDVAKITSSVDELRSLITSFSRQWTLVEEEYSRKLLYELYWNMSSTGAITPDYGEIGGYPDAPLIWFSHFAAEGWGIMAVSRVDATTNHNPIAGVMVRQLHNQRRSDPRELLLACVYQGMKTGGVACDPIQTVMNFLTRPDRFENWVPASS